MNPTLKRLALTTFRSTGMFRVASRVRRRDTLVILCYHGISLRDEHEWEGGLYITPEQFRDRMTWLRELNANVLPLGEAFERLGKHSLPPRSVVITFDDGFYDFYRYAWPVVSEFGYPCTLYLTTYYSRYRLPIFNLMINYLLWKGGVKRDQASRCAEVDRYMNEAAAQQLTTEAKDEVVRGLAESLGIDYGQLVKERMFQIMSPEEAGEVARGGIDLQLHTHRHRTPLDRELFVREIVDNSRCIEEICGRRPAHFCYPSGVTSPEFLPWLKECGVVTATTCVSGLATVNSEPLLLPRYLDGTAVDKLSFECWLSGLR